MASYRQASTTIAQAPSPLTALLSQHEESTARPIALSPHHESSHLSSCLSVPEYDGEAEPSELLKLPITQAAPLSDKQSAEALLDTQSIAPFLDTPVATLLSDTQSATSLLDTQSATPLSDTQLGAPHSDTQSAVPPPEDTQSIAPFLDTKAEAPLPDTQSATPSPDIQSAAPVEDVFAHPATERTCFETSSQISSLPSPQNRRVAKPSRSPECPRTRKEYFIQAVNATYAVCRRWDLNPQTRALALPVYQFNPTTFFVPASRPWYKKLCHLIHQTEAKRTVVSFRESVELSGHTHPVSGVLVEMVGAAHEIAKTCGEWIDTKVNGAGWMFQGQPLVIVPFGATRQGLVPPDDRRNFGQEPDESFKIKGAEYPFIVLEVRDGETTKHLRTKIHRWAQYSETKIKIICWLEVITDPLNQYRIVFSVMRLRKESIPSIQNPNAFQIQQEIVLEQEDISSVENPKSFTISASEVCPDNWEQDPSTMDDPSVTIALSSMHPKAVIAVREKIAEMARAIQAKLNPKKWDPNQKIIHTPTSSVSSEWNSGSEIEDPADGDYTPSGPW